MEIRPRKKDTGSINTWLKKINLKMMQIFIIKKKLFLVVPIDGIPVFLAPIAPRCRIVYFWAYASILFHLLAWLSGTLPCRER